MSQNDDVPESIERDKPPKLSYQAPLLRELGSFVDVTQASGTHSSNLDSGPPYMS